MTGPALTVELANQDGVRIATLEHVNDLRVRRVRNKPLSVSGTIFVDKERFAVEQWAEYKSRLLVYLDDVLIGHTLVGVCTDEVKAASELLKFTSADPLASPLGRREVQTAATYTAQDQGAIIKARIDAQNTRATTFISTSAYSFTTGTNRTMTVDVGKPEAQIIAEICAAYDGVDFEIEPTAVDGSTTMGQARVWANRGAILDNIAFETSGKQNVEGFTVVNDPGKITTHQRVPGRDGALGSGSDAGTQTDYGTIFDSTDTFADLASSTLLQAVCTQLLEWRSQPRQVVQITPRSNAFLPVRDFNVADFLPVHLEGSRYQGDRAISGAVRCHGWEITRDAGGEAILSSLVVLPEDQGGA